MDYINQTTRFVVQFGYRGEPAVDSCWDAALTSNITWSVAPPGNSRGYVSFSMNAVPNRHDNPNCTSPTGCAVGFSTNIYINYGDNRRLDSAGFAVFGRVNDTGMDVVDSLFSGYGEVADLCAGPDPFTGEVDRFCHGTGKDCTGVNVSQLINNGMPYIARFPRLDRVESVHRLSFATSLDEKNTATGSQNYH